jgi:hypothetical protein
MSTQATKVKEKKRSSQNLEADPTKDTLPTAELMIDRLNSINLEQFDVDARMDLLKGKWNWVFILTMPISALLLVIFTLLGMFIADNFIIGFIFSSILVFSIAKIIDGYEKQFRRQARKQISDTVAEIEGELGLLHHYKEFLPAKYRHLWQTTRKKNFSYIEQYKAAILLLQRRLEVDKFIKLWHLKYPMTDPEYVKEILEEEKAEKKRKETAEKKRKEKNRARK